MKKYYMKINHIFISTISKPERYLGELCTVAPAVRITFLVVATYAKKKKKKEKSHQCGTWFKDVLGRVSRHLQ